MTLVSVDKAAFGQIQLGAPVQHGYQLLDATLKVAGADGGQVDKGVLSLVRNHLGLDMKAHTREAAEDGDVGFEAIERWRLQVRIDPRAKVKLTPNGRLILVSGIFTGRRLFLELCVGPE